MIFRGSGSVLLANPIDLQFVRGGGGGVADPCPPSGSAHIAELSGSVGRLGIKGLLNQYSLPAELLCCVLEQDTLSHA